MKEVVIISGKGGTGKTSVVAAFASLAENKALCDADVDAADLHLIMRPDILERHDFVSGNTAVIQQEKCTRCGLCRDLCRWHAISEDFVVDSIECEGCGVCFYFCPEEAIDFPANTCGEWFISNTRLGPMAHASLGIAEENSGKLVTLVRQEGKKLAQERGLDLLITDGPPGVGCPVIASIGGADAVLIVAEPTVSGKHDMERVAELAAFFRVPAMMCTNKFDLNPDMCEAMETFAADKGISVLGRIPFDSTFTKAMVEGMTLLEFNKDSEASKAVKLIWASLDQRLQAET
jgi:MinD superfamily P-loop ATPase